MSLGRGVALLFFPLYLWGNAPGSLTQESIGLGDPTGSQWGVSVGFPDLFSAQYSRALNERFRAGISLGGLPLSFIPNLLPVSGSSELSDQYSMVVNPNVYLFSISALLERAMGTGKHRFQLSVGVLVGNSRNTAVLVNRLSDKSLPVATIDASVFQPIIGLRYLRNLFRWGGAAMIGGIGLCFLPDFSFLMNVSGSGPAFLDVSPEWRTVVSDGVQKAQAEITEIVGSWRSKPRVLPSVFLQATW